MLGSRLEKAMNDQMKWEFYSEFLYLSMAASFLSLGLKGFAKWMDVQALEERSHAMKFFYFIDEAGGRIVINNFEKPPSDFTSAEEIMSKTVEHEVLVTNRINGLLSVAKDEGSEDVEKFLGWFVKEQEEEVETPKEILGRIRGGESLKEIDSELARRTFHE